MSKKANAKQNVYLAGYTIKSLTHQDRVILNILVGRNREPYTSLNASCLLGKRDSNILDIEEIFDMNLALVISPTVYTAVFIFEN